ncbi:MAG: hypothetical protein ACPIOQ_69550, partial [Promethearchaeia archaeon]
PPGPPRWHHPQYSLMHLGRSRLHLRGLDRTPQQPARATPVVFACVLLKVVTSLQRPTGDAPLYLIHICRKNEGRRVCMIEDFAFDCEGGC